ncbi:carbohydrate kinase (thermoresistant glucokinase family) [Deinococcus metalli]|uniref:Gluconokinase n=1 Tax=Deinococcus metalli TaxID=1141878 RepID=A0A7W8NRH2_9DEIO|nr:gluconokinase [Deinococcus metalli]MBB5377885.1 carbohydrate kinase (thermoresistant glucokinase family) [Deinococcus metalli]GHF55293.1 gluconokinase [Deinococcus metalli]
MHPTTAVIVMGVSGSGKTTLGRALAARLGWAFADADDFHPPANVEKMARGEPLTDADRAPWLAALHAVIARHAREGSPLVLACSALKDRYRQTLTGDLGGVRFVHVHGPRELIEARMRARQHFMPPSLLDSQFAALEPPTDAVMVDIARPVEQEVEQVVRALELA